MSEGRATTSLSALLVVPWMALLLTCAGCSSSGSNDSGSSSENPDVSLSATEDDVFNDFPNGSYRIHGTVSLPASIPAGRLMNVSIFNASTPGANLVASGTTRAGTSLRYAIDDIGNGSYTVRVRVDADGNSSVSDAHDYDGYYAGTTLSPADDSSASTITVNGANITADFGIGDRTVEAMSASN